MTPPPTELPKLAELGLTKEDSRRVRRIAYVPEDQFESYIRDTTESGKELTLAGVLALAKKNENKNRNSAFSPTATADIEELILQGKKFGTIYADPPWRYGNRASNGAAEDHYPTMTVDEIAALPVGQLAADDAHLHLWTTNAFLFESKRIMDSWGFTFAGCMVWVKPQMGCGNYWRVSHEILLLGVRGAAPSFIEDHASWVECGRTAHSRKPELFRRMIERVSPVPRLELFGRRPVDGWTVWGNEVPAVAA